MVFTQTIGRPDYKELARQARIKVLGLIHRAGTSHIASNFSALDFATVLYENLRPEDEVVWSKAWAAASIYYFLAKQGKISEEDLQKFPNPPYLGLAETTVPGVCVSGGSMAHGLSVAYGKAYSRKLQNKRGTIYCIVSDGEHQEGSTWEAILRAAHDKLDNLVVFVDYNKWCAMGRTNEVANLEPFEAKYEAFNWEAIRIDGHDYAQIEKVILSPKETERPRVIICDTIKGKGVSFMEGHLLFHYHHVDVETYKKALEELNCHEHEELKTCESRLLRLGQN